MTIDLETRCRVCGRLWIPLRQDFVDGIWHTCSRCRDPDPPSSTPRPIIRNPALKRTFQAPAEPKRGGRT